MSRTKALTLVLLTAVAGTALAGCKPEDLAAGGKAANRAGRPPRRRSRPPRPAPS